jgi:hypothetical protein
MAEANKNTATSNPWYDYNIGVSGAHFSNSAGAKAEVYTGWNHSTTVGVKSDWVVGGVVQNNIGGVLSTVFGGVWNVYWGREKETSFGSLKDFRKGNVTNVIVGKQEQVLLNANEKYNVNKHDDYIVAQQSKINLDKSSEKSLFRSEILASVQDEKFTKKTSEITDTWKVTANEFNLSATSSTSIEAKSVEIEAADKIYIKALSGLTINAPSTYIKGNVSLGGVSVPELATLQALAEAQAKLAATAAELQLLKVQAANSAKQIAQIIAEIG